MSSKSIRKRDKRRGGCFTAEDRGNTSAFLFCISITEKRYVCEQELMTGLEFFNLLKPKLV
jgi:hypothetical protein